jgi:hypothetical protein
MSVQIMSAQDRSAQDVSARIEIRDEGKPELVLGGSGDADHPYHTGPRPEHHRALVIHNFVSAQVRVCFRREKDLDSSAPPRPISSSFATPVNLDPDRHLIASVTLDAAPTGGESREYHVLLHRDAWSTPKDGAMTICVNKLPISGNCTFPETDSHTGGIIIDGL